MTDEQKPAVAIDDGDEHGAKIPIENLHVSVLEIIQEMKARFQTKTGKEAKYLYAPEPLCWMIDHSIKSKALAEGKPFPRHSAVVNVYDMEIHVVLGTCTTLTAEPLHEVSERTPAINAPHPSTMQ